MHPQQPSDSKVTNPHLDQQCHSEELPEINVCQCNTLAGKMVRNAIFKLLQKAFHVYYFI
jgi:hypothetical protein